MDDNGPNDCFRDDVRVNAPLLRYIVILLNLSHEEMLELSDDDTQMSSFFLAKANNNVRSAAERPRRRHLSESSNRQNHQK